VVNKNPNKKNFDSIVNMLAHPNCKISDVSYSSLKGFVFKLYVEGLEEKDVEFYGLNEETNVFDVPVNTLIIKMTILYTREGNIIQQLNDYANVLKSVIQKESETFDNFKNEALIQSMIYEKTLIKGEPLCPALIDFSHFNDREASDAFLNAIMDKCITEESKSMISYLLNETQNQFYQLAMITMESALDYEKYSVARTKYSDSKNILKSQALSKIIRLFNETRITHCDLHGGNLLVKRKENGMFKLVMIDFGMALNVDFLTHIEKETLQGYAEGLFEVYDFFDNNANVSEDLSLNVFSVNETTVEKIIQFVVCVDLMYGKTRLELSERSPIYKNYYVTNFKLVIENLKSYYSSDILCDSTYKSITQNDNYDKKLQNFETLCGKIKELEKKTGSPVRSVFIPQAAIEVVRKKRGEQEERPIFLNLSIESEGSDIHSYPNVVNAFQLSSSSSIPQVNFKKRLQMMSGGKTKKKRRVKSKNRKSKKNRRF